VKTIVVSNIEVDSSSLSYPEYNPCTIVWGLFVLSDNTVNKWCKFYDIKKPGRGDWGKIKYGKLDIPKQ